MDRKDASASPSRRTILQLLAALSMVARFRDAYAATEPSLQADTIYVNGKFVTLDTENTVAQAVAVKDGKILRVGSTAQIEALAKPDTTKVDLRGKTVLPGFVDGHCHPETMLQVLGFPDVHVNTVPTLADALAKIAAEAKTKQPGEWVIGAGAAVNSERWPEKRMPTRTELDEASPNSPVIYMNGPHTWVVNSLAVKAMALPHGEKHFKGAIIDLDAKGEPTGVIHEGSPLFPHPAIPDAVMRSYLTKDFPDFFLSRGVTSLTAIMAVPNAATIARLAADRLTIPMRYSVVVYADSGGHFLPQSFDEFHMPASADPERLRFGGIKIWLDGDVPVRTGYVFDPYEKAAASAATPEQMAGLDPVSGEIGSNAYGFATSTPEQLLALVTRVGAAGLGMYVHATGDRANVMALDAFEAAKKAGRAPQPMRIEHFGDFMLGPNVIDRARTLDVKANVQPGWIWTLANNVRTILGDSRAMHGSFQFRKMIDGGIEPGFGSDLTGFQRGTENPFMHIEAAVTRISMDGKPFVPSQAITVEEALRIMTIWSARAQGEDKIKGSLEPGKFADMIVLSDDITTIAPEAISDTRVLETFVGGASVYRANAP